MVRQKEIGAFDQILVLSIVFLSIVAYNVPRLSEWLVYDRRAILDGELWRLVTAPLVHFSASHLLWDAAVFGAAGLAVHASGFRGFWLLCGFGAAAPGLIFLLASPGLGRYGGLSGLATAAVSYYCLCRVSPAGPRRMIWLLILSATGLKIIVETATRAPVFAHMEGVSFHVLPSVHLIGLLGAMVTFFLNWCKKLPENHKP